MSEYKIWQPMKYATAKKEDVLKAALEDSNYCIQLKKDGSSYVWAKDLDGSVHLYGDKISKKTGGVIDKIDNVPHLREFAEKNFPNGTQLIVEITFGDKSADVNTIMLALPAKAIARQVGSPCGAYIFDILYWSGLSLFERDFQDRWDKIVDIFHYWQINSLTSQWLSLAETHFDNKSEIIAGWLSSGEEGGVLKMLHSTKKTSAAHHVRELGATPARPMNTTFKIKQVDTVDVVIIGVEMPTSTYTGKDPENHGYKDENGNAINRLYALGMANSFTIGVYGDFGKMFKVGTVASGLNDEMRLHAAQNPQEYIGTVIEVDCMSIDKVAKSLRHPRLMRQRPDKVAGQCIMEEVFA